MKTFLHILVTTVVSGAFTGLAGYYTGGTGKSASSAALTGAVIAVAALLKSSPLDSPTNVKVNAMDSKTIVDAVAYNNEVKK